MQRTIPIVAIRGAVIFLTQIHFLSFGRNKSIDAVNLLFKTIKLLPSSTKKIKYRQSRTFRSSRNRTIATVKSNDVNRYEVHAMIKGQVRVHLDENF